MNKLTKILAIFSILLLVASCGNDNSVATSTNERGTTSFDCTMLSSVNDQTTRSEDEAHFQIPENLIPATSDVTLKITGSYVDAETAQTTEYSYGPLTLADYQNSRPMMIASNNYHADFSWGTAGEEGEASPYFGGAIDFAVIARGKTTEQVSIKLQNSIVCVEIDEIFENYYTDAEFTITTGSGNSFEFTAETTDKIVFVEAATTLTLSGTASKIRGGAAVTFNPAQIGETTSQTLSRINISANEQIGGSKINIDVDGTIYEMEPTIVELNPQGN